MTTQAKGWQLRRRLPGGVLYVRFSVASVQHERSTGFKDYQSAAAEAEKIYAAEVLKASAVPSKKRRGNGERYSTQLLEVLIASWLLSLESTHAANTRRTWELYAGAHWLPFFQHSHNLTPANAAEYMKVRLAKVVAETVKKELTALRSFLNWCVAEGEIPRPSGEPLVPSLPKRAKGTPHPTKRRAAAVALRPEHVEAWLAALPEWSLSKKVERFPVRARFVLAYETSLRPSSLTRIETPKHYRRGETTLRLTADTDKARWGRDVPLTARARQALDAVLDALGDDYAGPIFGEHDYSAHVRQAAAVLPSEVRDRFCGAHLRSARITHLLERGGTLPAVQFLAGHRRTDTTSRYVRPSFQAAEQMLDQTLAAVGG